jgi:hypothetical protein
LLVSACGSITVWNCCTLLRKTWMLRSVHTVYVVYTVEVQHHSPSA